MLWSTQWINISIDLILLDQLRHRISKRIEYNHCRFQRINENDEEYEDSIEWLQNRTLGDRIGLKVVIGFLVILGTAASFTALSVRSLFENPYNISNLDISFTIAEEEDNIDFLESENLANFTIPNATVTSFHIDAVFSGSPKTYQFKLNGRILSDVYCNKRLSAIWDDEIFP